MQKEQEGAEKELQQYLKWWRIGSKTQGEQNFRVKHNNAKVELNQIRSIHEQTKLLRSNIQLKNGNVFTSQKGKRPPNSSRGKGSLLKGPEVCATTKHAGARLNQRLDLLSTTNSGFSKHLTIMDEYRNSCVLPNRNADLLKASILTVAAAVPSNPSQ